MNNLITYTRVIVGNTLPIGVFNASVSNKEFMAVGGPNLSPRVGYSPVAPAIFFPQTISTKNRNKEFSLTENASIALKSRRKEFAIPAPISFNLKARNKEFLAVQ